MLNGETICPVQFLHQLILSVLFFWNTLYIGGSNFFTFWKCFWRYFLYCLFWTASCLSIKILTGKTHDQIKFKHLRKVKIWTRVLMLKLNFQENKVTRGKTMFFVISQFCTSYCICFNIDFWHGSFLWTCCVFDYSNLN